MKNIPVVMLITSRETSDRIESFKLNGAEYIVKPVEFEDFVSAVKAIDVDWTFNELI